MSVTPFSFLRRTCRASCETYCNCVLCQQNVDREPRGPCLKLTTCSWTEVLLPPLCQPAPDTDTLDEQQVCGGVAEPVSKKSWRVGKVGIDHGSEVPLLFLRHGRSSLSFCFGTQRRGECELRGGSWEGNWRWSETRLGARPNPHCPMSPSRFTQSTSSSSSSFTAVHERCASNLYVLPYSAGEEDILSVSADESGI